MIMFESPERERILKKSRAEKAGERLGGAIIEMANLMYQNNTKTNFYKGLLCTLRKSGEEDE